MSAWANRKAAVQAEATALEAATEDAAIAEQHAALAEKPEEEVLAELDLPNPDDMQMGDDFSVFMQASVPMALRNRALHTLWRSNPVLANVDMLVDYGEDFTGKGDALAVVKTIYRVGKGMLKDEGEIKPVPTAKKPLDVTPLEEDEVPTEALVEVVAPETVMESEAAEAAPLAPRRRMRFDFAKGDMPAATGMDI